MTPLADVRSLGLSSHAPLPSATATLAGVDVAFGATPVLRQLNWQLLPGQVVGLLGRNGAGKTTLLETLLGLREPNHGEVRLLGQAAAALDDAARARIGYVPQHSNLFEWLTPQQLLDYFRSFYPRWNTAKVDALMAAWDLRRDLPIAKLSGGQQQRLSIVRALAHDPDLLVLDEPVASLDPVGRRDFLRELVERVIDRGTTVVFSTHILSDLERVAFNFAFLAHGHIVLQAPLDELKETCRIAAPDPALLRLPGVQRLGSAGAAAPRWLLRGEPGTAWPAGCVAPSLEDLFGELTA